MFCLFVFLLKKQKASETLKSLDFFSAALKACSDFTDKTTSLMIRPLPLLISEFDWRRREETTIFLSQILPLKATLQNGIPSVSEVDQSFTAVEPECYLHSVIYSFNF